jgi:hypothetical protein
MDDFAAKDRSAGLLAFGILQIVIGLICATALLGVVASSEVAARAGATNQSVGSILFVLGALAFYFIATGIGSIRGRRWACALSAAVSGLWLAGGAVATITTAVVVPKIVPEAPLAGLVLMMFAGLVVVPLLLLLFYLRYDVRLTCDRRDKPRWTDRVPVAVLALVVVMAFAAAYLLVNASSPIVPLFGTVMTGAPAALAVLALAALCGVLAVQLYRLKESAWWTVVLLQIVGCTLTAMSMARTSGPVYRDPVMWTIVIASWVGYFAFLMYVRRYFAGGRAGRPRVAEAT